MDPTPESHLDEVLAHWRLRLIKPLGGRENMHWLVESEGCRHVLRRYAAKPFGDIGFELNVMNELHSMDWPVPTAVAEPIKIGGREWCLLTWMSGEPRITDDEERRSRGRLLAELHDSLTKLTIPGQRAGMFRSDEVVNDPELLSLVKTYEERNPSAGHVLRWHLEHTINAFAGLDVEAADTFILHGDFTPWNLLYEGNRLSGILDFEVTHRSFRVAEFALSWRGVHDMVIEGYQEVHKLTDLDWDLLVPAYWAWLFICMKDMVRQILFDCQETSDFKWTIDHLLRRPTVPGRPIPPYPGPNKLL